MSRTTLCAAVIILISTVFAVINRASFWLVICSFPLGFLTGHVMFFLEGRILALHREAMNRYGRIQSGFLAFFVFLFAGILVFLVILTYPMGLVAERAGDGYLAVHYGRWMINLGIIVSLACWFKCVANRMKGNTG